MDESINNIEEDIMSSKGERHKRVQTPTGFPKPIVSLRQKTSPRLSQGVSAAVYSAMFGTSHSAMFGASHMQSVRAGRDTTSFTHVGRPSPSTSRMQTSYKLEKGLKERIVSSRRVIRTPEVFGEKFLEKTETDRFKEELPPKPPTTDSFSKDRIEKHANGANGGRDHHAFQSNIWELADVEDCEIDYLRKYYTAEKVSLNMEYSQKKNIGSTPEKGTENTCLEPVLLNSSEALQKPKKRSRNKTSKKHKSKKFQRIRYAKIFPIDIPDENQQNRKSKEYLKRIADMFCTEKTHSQHSCQITIQENDDEDAVFQPGIWGCSFVDASTKIPSATEEADVDIKPLINTVQENYDITKETKEEKTKKKGNRIWKFFRNIRNIFKRK